MKKNTTPKHMHAPRDIARAIALLSSVRRIMRAKLARGKRIDPSTWLRIETMKFIGDRGNPKMKDIADYLSITAPSATSLVGGLVKSGCVVCRADPSDRRTSRIRLSRKGKSTLKKAVARGMRIASALFAALSRNELAALTRALERIREHSSE